MPQSESIAKLVEALAKAQKKFTVVPKTKTGQEGLRKFKYADLADVMNMALPKLNEEGVFLNQPLVMDNVGGFIRQTTRLQLGDEFIQSDGIKLSDDVPGKNLGISVTYARRIDLNGVLGIAPDEDVDAPDLKPVESTFTNVPAKAPAVIKNNPVINPNKPSVVAPSTQTPSKSTSFEFGANQQARTITNTGTEITDADLPDFDIPLEKLEPLSAEAQAVAEQMESFVPLSEKRNTEIQNRLKELVANKTVGRRDLSLFLEDQHDGKKQFDVDAKQWESTIGKIEEAISNGEIKGLLKTKKGM